MALIRKIKPNSISLYINCKLSIWKKSAAIPSNKLQYDFTSVPTLSVLRKPIKNKVNESIANDFFLLLLILDRRNNNKIK